jgi:hypothetical protein
LDLSKDGRDWVGAASLPPGRPVPQPIRQIGIRDQTLDTADDDLADFFGVLGDLKAIQVKAGIHRLLG